jgi:hypothetical protein
MRMEEARAAIAPTRRRGKSTSVAAASSRTDESEEHLAPFGSLIGTTGASG